MPDATAGLYPEPFWRCFSEISRIPRPSGHEAAIGDFILARAGRLGLEARQDSGGNIVVRKNASPGREQAPGVCLQSHLDMVCEKNADTVHDFLKDPIELIRDGHFVTANGTTLGADNGVGVATSLAIMEDRFLEHGPLEFLFTVEEETGLTGAKSLDADLVESRTLVNLDSEEEGVVYVGCAGGRDTLGKWRVQREPAFEGGEAFRVTVKGLRGGHSGLEIDKGLGNAIRILNRVVLRLAELGGRLVSMDGGNMRNAIPRECSAVLLLPRENADRARQVVADLERMFRAELGAVDPELSLAVEREAQVQQGGLLPLDLQRRLCLALAAMPTGVQRMSADISGLVETSTNVSVVTTSESEVVLVTSQRSSVASRLDEVAETVRSVFELAGASVEVSAGYPGWKPDLDSGILKVARECYRMLHGKEVGVKAIHAGLECGIIGERFPGMDMISLGPTMEGVHSPDERLHIESVGRYWEFLLAMLRSVS